VTRTKALDRIPVCLTRAEHLLGSGHTRAAQIHLEEALSAILDLPSSEQDSWLQQHDSIAARLPPPDFTCDGCGGKCCRNVYVILRPEEEAYFLANHPDQLETRYLSEKAVMVFKNTVRENGSFICPFMNQSTGWCGIYENRPAICRIFPVGCYGCTVARSIP